jgi:plastocyanin
MTRSALVLCSTAVLALLAAGRGDRGVPEAAAQAAPEAAVAVRVFQLHPKELEVRAGTRVTWTNEDAIEHTVTSGAPDNKDGKFDGALRGKGTTFSHTFTQPGTYPYFCARHRAIRGEIRVK